jgi:hypothetical protein
MGTNYHNPSGDFQRKVHGLIEAIGFGSQGRKVVRAPASPQEGPAGMSNGRVKTDAYVPYELEPKAVKSEIAQPHDERARRDEDDEDCQDGGQGRSKTNALENAMEPRR